MLDLSKSSPTLSKKENFLDKINKLKKINYYKFQLKPEQYILTDNKPCDDKLTISPT